MTPQGLPMTNPISIKTRFTYKFLKALKRLSNNNRRLNPQSSSKELFRRYRTVKLAADASMASAVGPRRAWSRAVLRRRRRGYGRFIRRRGERNKDGKRCGVSQTDELRGLVPGGEEMDFCSLLSETAHYIKCLNTQVTAMKNIVDLCSL